MACRNHPQVESGLEHCYRCGYRFCEECRVDFQGKEYCAACKAEAVGMLEVGESPRPAEGMGELPPWERRQELGMASAFWETIKAVMSDPTRFFRTLDTRVTSYDCLAIPCVLSLIGAVVGAILQVGMMGTLMGIMQAQGGVEGEEAAAMFIPQVLGGCGGIVFAPVAAILLAFLFGFLIHLFLMMTGKVGAPYHQTMRGYCYAQAPSILGIIPILGGLVGWIWTLWTTVVMVKELHRTTWGTAWISALWYIVLCCFAGVGLWAVVFGLVAASAGR